MNTNTAARLESIDNLDTFSTPDSVVITGDKVRECMVLLDPELGTPLYWIDHKMPATRGSGDVKFMVHNLETGRIETVNIFRSTNVPAMAR